MPNRFTKAASDVLNNAMSNARTLGHTYIGTEHILLGLLSVENGVASKLLTNRGVTLEKTRELVSEIAGTGEPSDVGPGDMTPRTKRLIEIAARESMRLGQNYIGTEHILLAMLNEPDCVGIKLLSLQNVTTSDIAEDLTAFFRESASGAGGEEPASAFSGERPGASGKEGGAMLSQYGRDLTALAREGKLDPVIGRETETERVVQILSRRTKNNPCLIGEPGVGKTAVVEGLAQRIADGSVPETLTDKKIITLDIPGMIAGAKYRGEFEERMKGVMNEVMKDKSIILFIDEIHTIIGAGAAEGAVDAANILKPALARGDMQVIGATTINEYRKHIEKDAALERRFQSVMVGEPSPEEAELILKGLRDKYEAHHKVKITDEAIEAAVKYSVRYIGDRYLPDKAIDLIDEAASKLRISSYTAPDSIKELENKLKQISSEKEEAIGSQEFERAAKLRDEEKKLRDEIDKAVKSLTEDEGTRLMHLEEELHKRIVGQSEAVNAVSRAIRRSRVGLKDPRRPMGSFIFLGPTGVGKTELCKALAEILFGDENAMIRVDMSEYMEKHSVSKMIGSPPGYVGFDEGGQLTEKIRRHPYSVVLFDEIEKAHPDVFNILLQILEDGILTDAQGRRVDFKNSIIIMTSNVGASGLIQKASALGFGGDDTPKSEDARIHERVMASLRETFKPEFLNRIDEIIVFSKLSDDEIKEIASLMLKSVEKRLDSMNISISFDDDVIALLAREGTDPVYGARPMRREIQRRIEDALSTEILDGKIAAGDSVQCRLDGDNILFEKSK